MMLPSPPSANKPRLPRAQRIAPSQKPAFCATLPACMPFLELFTAHLREPHTGARLIATPDGFTSAADEMRTYPVLDGVIQLVAPEQRLKAEKLSQQHDSQSTYPQPSIADFRALPREIPAGWPEAEWKSRAASTATLWRLLEERRRASNQLPIGSLGTAAVFASGLDYLGYGLDVGGYVTYSMSPHRGPYGLGIAPPESRYTRSQISWDAVPLAEGVFDIVVCNDIVPLIDPSVEFLQRLLRLLRPDGVLFVLDNPNPDPVCKILAEQGLHPTKISTGENKGFWSGLLRKVRSSEFLPLIMAPRMTQK